MDKKDRRLKDKFLMQVLIDKQLHDGLLRKANENGLKMSGYVRFVLINIVKGGYDDATGQRQS